MTSADNLPIKKQQPTLLQAVFSVAFLIVLLTFNVLTMKDEAISRLNHIPMTWGHLEDDNQAKKSNEEGSGKLHSQLQSKSPEPRPSS